MPAANGQLALVRAHPELAGKAMVAGSLTHESTGEQGRAGLPHCTPEQFVRLQQFNADYNARFGFPFVLAVHGPRGQGLTRAGIIETFARRLDNSPAFELAEALRDIHRIAEIRLNDKFGVLPEQGHRVWVWAERLAHGAAPADRLALRHRPQRRQVRRSPRHPGADGQCSGAIAVRLAAALRHRGGGLCRGRGPALQATFLGSGALTGDFDTAWLDQLGTAMPETIGTDVDTEGTTRMRRAVGIRT